MYYWQHEDTGRVCKTDFKYPPSKRWYAIGKKDYEEYLDHQSICNHDVQVPRLKDVLHDAERGLTTDAPACGDGQIEAQDNEATTDD